MTLNVTPVVGGRASLASWGTLELTGAASALLRLNWSENAELPETIAADITAGVKRGSSIQVPSRWSAGDRIVTAELAHRGLLEVLNDLVVLLSGANQRTYSRGISSIHDALRDSQGDRAREQAVIREILALYGGMGSFQDLVLQDSDGMRPEQDEFDRLRHRLFEEARAALR